MPWTRPRRARPTGRFPGARSPGAECSASGRWFGRALSWSRRLIIGLTSPPKPNDIAKLEKRPAAGTADAATEKGSRRSTSDGTWDALPGDPRNQRFDDKLAAEAGRKAADGKVREMMTEAEGLRRSEKVPGSETVPGSDGVPHKGEELRALGIAKDSPAKRDVTEFRAKSSGETASGASCLAATGSVKRPRQYPRTTSPCRLVRPSRRNGLSWRSKRPLSRRKRMSNWP